MYSDTISLYIGRLWWWLTSGEDVSCLIQPVDLVGALGIHHIRRVPTARGVEDDVVRSVVFRELPFGDLAEQHPSVHRDGKAQTGEGAAFQELASCVHGPVLCCINAGMVQCIGC